MVIERTLLTTNAPRQGIMSSGLVSAFARYLVVLIVTEGMIKGVFSVPLVAKCPPGSDQVDDSENSTPSPAEGSYCKCLVQKARSGLALAIICDFKFKEDAVLTDDLFPFWNMRLMTMHITIANATSVQVTSGFLAGWQIAPSSALDIYQGGTVTLDSSPQIQHSISFASFWTYLGISIMKSYIPEIPPGLLRDRTHGSLKIEKSRVGVIRRGVLKNMRTIRYFVVEDSEVDVIEGSVAEEGIIVLNPYQIHRWKGFQFYNVSVTEVGDGSFHLTYKKAPDMNPCESQILRSRIGSLGIGAFTVSGDIAVTIKGNQFQQLDGDSLKVNTTQSIRFEENVIEELLSPNGLTGLLCSRKSSLERNTVHVQSSEEDTLKSSTSPFHASCGNPQIFTVVTPSKQRVVEKTSAATWVLLTLLLILLAMIVAVAILTQLRQGFKLRTYRRGESGLCFSGLEQTHVDGSNAVEDGSSAVSIEL